MLVDYARPSVVLRETEFAPLCLAGQCAQHSIVGCIRHLRGGFRIFVNIDRGFTKTVERHQWRKARLTFAACMLR